LGQTRSQAPRLDQEVVAESVDPTPAPVASSSNEEDEALSYFQKLADS